MKQKLIFLLMATALTLGFVACSEDGDDKSDETKEKPVDKPLQDSYIISVQAEIGAYIGADKVLTSDENLLLVSWRKDSYVDVTAPFEQTVSGWLEEYLGSVDVLSDGTITTLSSRIRYSAENKTPLYLYYPRAASIYRNQNGTIASFAANKNYVKAVLNPDDYEFVGDSLKAKANVVFSPLQALVKYMLRDEDGNSVSVDSLRLESMNDGEGFVSNANYPTGKTVYDSHIDIILAAAASDVFVAMPTPFNQPLHITAYSNVGIYTCDVTSVNYIAGHCYADTLTMTRIARYVNLSEATSHIELEDGDIVSGELINAYKVSVADGAMVTLNNVHISGVRSYGYTAPGIDCKGNATIILKGENFVEGGEGSYPGIYIRKGHTLTISGNGAITAQALGEAAGIGGGRQNLRCGNIIIESGTVNALGRSAAGIGGGYQSTCGNILISGGTVSATGHGAGIGAGPEGKIESVTITNGITQIESTGSPLSWPIGPVKGDDNGSPVIIDGITVTGPDWRGEGLQHLDFFASDDGYTWILKHK